MKTKEIKNQVISSLVAIAIKWLWKKIFSSKENKKCQQNSSEH